MKKFLKKSDKGFSLVELIVVIAIMAVLIGIIAPAFMKYVGKSKDSAKAANLDELRKAANTVLADPELEELNDKGTLVIKKGVVGDTDDTIGGNFKTLLEAALGGADKYPKDRNYTITINGSLKDGYSATVTFTELD